MTIPKTLWIFWLQGFENAPPLVHICLKSWKRQNPDWTIRLLSESNIREYLDPDFCNEVLAADLPYKKISNVFRMALIARHGGVYADADCFCTQPLDTWIHKAAGSGFFVFCFLESNDWLHDTSVSRVDRITARTFDRIIASWFLAGKAGNEITDTLALPHFRLLAHAEKTSKWFRQRVSKRIYKRMKRNAYLASMSGNPSIVRRIGYYPFFVMHYHFAHLVRTNSAFRQAWARVEKRSADSALKYSQTLGLPMDDEFKEDMAGKGSPVYKFHYRKTEPLQEGSMTRYQWLEQEN